MHITFDQQSHDHPPPYLPHSFSSSSSDSSSSSNAFTSFWLVDQPTLEMDTQIDDSVVSPPEKEMEKEKEEEKEKETEQSDDDLFS